MIEAVVFDMDGVLFDTERISCECFFQAAKELCLPVTQDAVYGCLGRNAAGCREHVISSMEHLYPGQSFPYDTYIGRIEEIFEERLKDGPPMLEGVKELLKFLTGREIKTAVASSTSYDRVMSNLTSGGIDQYFQKVITGNMVERGKPMPDIYLKACEALSVRPEAAMAVEDSPNGLRSARAAGMTVVMVPDMIRPSPELEPFIDMTFRSLTELKLYLESENSCLI